MKLAAWTIETEVQRFKNKTTSNNGRKAEHLTADESQSLCNYVRTLATYKLDLKAAILGDVDQLDAMTTKELIRAMVLEAGGKQSLLDIVDELAREGSI